MSLTVRFAFIFLLAFFYSSLGAVTGGLSASSQPRGRISFQAYTVEQGLTNLTVIHIYQDKQGFIWVASDDGLFRYGGSRFEAYGLKEGLPSSEITFLQEAEHGDMWVSTPRGLARWNGRGFTAVSYANDAARMRITGLAYFQKQLWVASDHGPYIRNEQAQFKPVPGWQFGKVTAMSKHAKLESSQESPDHALYLAAWQDQAQLYEYRQQQWHQLALPPELAQTRISAIVEDGQQRLWVRSTHSLWVRPRGEQQFQLANTVFPLTGDSGDAQLILGNHGDVWLPSQGGLIHIDGDKQTAYTTQDGLPTPWIRTAMQDKEGSLWVGSTGLYRILGRGIWRTFSQSEGLPIDRMRAIVRDQSGQLWAGTDNGLAQVQGDRWQAIVGTSGFAVRSIFQLSDQELLLAGAPATQVFRYHTKTQQLRAIPINPEVNAERINRLILDRHGRLWAGTKGGGLWQALFHDKNWRFTQLELPGSSPRENFTDVDEDSEGRIWTTGEHGLMMLESDRWHRFTVQHGLRHNNTRFIRSTRDGDLLFSYFESYGVTRARFQDGQFRILQHYDSAHGLENDKIYLFGEDIYKRVWIGTAKGVDLITPKGIEHFGIYNGLPGEDTNTMAFLAENNGDVWIGTSTGLGLFQAARYTGLTAAPKTVFLQLKLGKQIHQAQLEPHIVSADTALFETQFASLAFSQEKAIQQEVRLLGLENEWHPANSHEARYAGLNYGNYQFEARSRIGLGEWGPPAVFRFIVLPHWWQTWWFRSLMVLLALVIIALLIRWRVHALRRRNLALEAMVQERTKALELANEALKNQSLTDSLTGLRNRRYLGESMLEHIAQVTRVTREVVGDRRERLSLNINLLFIMVDLDHFKHINDQYGHAAGDKVLKQLAAILKSCIRETDTAVRWGGEEFLIVGRLVSQAEASVVIERIRARVSAHPFDIEQAQPLHVTCSIGFALYPFVAEIPDALHWEKIVEIADACLYLAKRSGRDAWVGVQSHAECTPSEAVKTRPDNLHSFVDRGVLQLQSSLTLDKIVWAEQAN